MFATITKLTVRYVETDQMGIVHHSNYPIWYEAARADFVRKLGTTYSKIEEDDVMLPLIELKSTYKESAKYEDEITIKTTIKELKYCTLVFSYELSKNDNPKVINYGETVHVFTNRKLKPINLKKVSPDIFKILDSIIN